MLIYLLLADRRIEIIADRGIDRIVGRAGWESICREMESRFRTGDFEDGVLRGIELITEILIKHYPPISGDINELSNKPVVL